MLCEICSGANANYGYKGGIKQFCSICAKTLPNTCNLTRKLCKEETCLKEPSFNYEGVSGKLYCTTHKLPGMILINVFILIMILNVLLYLHTEFKVKKLNIVLNTVSFLKI